MKNTEVFRKTNTFGYYVVGALIFSSVFHSVALLV
jgi:hypothetical protein